MQDAARWVDDLAGFVERYRDLEAVPAIALAVTDRRDTVYTVLSGYADQEAERPLDHGTLFQFGSIGKSITALALTRLAEEGTVDLFERPAAYLPWFRVKGDEGAIRLHHLLTHSAGLIAGTDFSPDARFEVWALRDTRVGWPPGQRFYYSNLGYKVLGLILEAVTGQLYADVVRRLVLEPAGMGATAAVITHALRNRLAVGYMPVFDDRPYVPGDPLAVAPWIETDTGDGCLSASIEDMARYVRLLLLQGRGVVSPNGFRHFVRPWIASGDGTGYGYGIVRHPNSDGIVIGHEGGMLGYHASILAHVDAGVGVAVLTNGPNQPATLARHALNLALWGLFKRGDPPTPPILNRELIPEAERYVGRWRAGEPDWPDLTITGDHGRLAGRWGQGPPAPLLRTAPSTFVLLDESRRLYPIRFGGGGPSALPTMAAWGPAWFARDSVVMPPATAADGWAGYPGHYRSHNPWQSNFRVVLRRSRLYLIHPDGSEWLLEPDDRPHAFRVVEDGEVLPETVTFDTPCPDAMLRVLVSQAPYYRFFTP
jgi:D-alanyl-D-alanine carboxypeptidase